MSRSPEQFSPPPEPPDALPPGLADDLSALFAAPRVPGRVDSAVLNAARAHGTKSARHGGLMRHRRPLRWAGAGAAAAAAVAAVLVWVVRPYLADRATRVVKTIAAPPGSSPSSRPAVAGDVDGNGRVDILDAFTVARALGDPNRTTPLPAAWDVNGDGVVDQKDVDWLANAAVRVGAVAEGQPKEGTEVFRLADNLKLLDEESSGGRRVARADAVRRGKLDRGLPAAAVKDVPDSEGASQGGKGAVTR